MRLTVVGGGSTYTPELVDGIARLEPGLPAVDELVLVDPNADRLAVVGGLARRILDRHGHPAQVVCTPDLAAGAEGASAVLVQIRVGGQQARASDESFPLEFGCIGQETTGAGGLAKALRTVPVVLDIAATVAAVAPAAWLINFTNPVGIVTRALLDAGQRTVGLCNVAIGFQRSFAGLFGVEPGAVRLDHVGLNHLSWERQVVIEGRDVLPELLKSHADDLAAQVDLPTELITRLGAIPSYYLRYFYLHDTVVEEQRRTPSRADRVATIERDLLALYADPTLAEKPALLGERGGAYYSEAALGLTAALLGGGTGGVHIVDTRNEGTLPFLPDTAVIEVPAAVDPTGVNPLPVRPLEPVHAGLVAHVAAYEELALAAAIHGGRDRVATTLLAHPLIGQYDIAERLTDRLLAANSDFLPWTRNP
jgi:6-phospho-beta-glucosidase